MASNHHGHNQRGVNAVYGHQKIVKSMVNFGPGGEADKSNHIHEFVRNADPSSDKRFIPDRHFGTCQWFLDLAEYQDWYKSTSTTLYVIGNPAVGKTVLAKFLVDELKKSENTKERTIYFFCKRQNKEHTSAVSILRSLIHQCMSKANRLWEKHVQRRYELYGPKLCDSFGELCEIFAEIMSDTEWKSGDWYCVLDALDHCDEDERESLLSNILPMDSRTVNSERCRPNLRLLVTSRPCGIMKSKLNPIGNATAIYFTDQKGESRNKHDIERYIEDKVADLAKQGGSVKDREDHVKNALKNGHGGMFKWVSCKVTTLERGIDDVDCILKRTPRDITDMFNGLASSIQDTYKPLFAWVTLACRDLSVTELNAAIEASQSLFLDSQWAPTIEKIRNSIWFYGGLLKSEDDKVVLLHQSAKGSIEAQHYKDQLPKLHAKIAKACVIYLSHKVLGQEPLNGRRKSDCRNDYKKLCENFPFLEYAASSWYKHVKKADCAGTDLWNFLMEIFVTKPIMELSFQVNQFSNHDNYISGQTCLHIFVHYDLHFFAEKWLGTTGTDPKVADNEGRTPLWWAAEKDNRPMVKLLLNAERIDPNSEEGKRGLSPLSVAVEAGRADVAKMLLEDERVDQNSHDHDGRTPLSLAAGAGHADVVRLLLGKEAVCERINSKDSISDQTPLLWASRKGHVSVVESLLEKGALPNLRDSERGRTSLVWAANNRHPAVVTTLLKERDVDLFLRDNDNWSAFELAAFREEDTTCNEILNAARETLDSWAESSFENFLLPAAGSCKEAAMKLLLKQDDIDPNFRDQKGRTALSLAAERGHVTIVQQLLDSRKVDINTRDDVEGQTPLHLAAKYGRRQIVKLLLENRDIDLSATDFRSRSAQELANDGGYHVIAHSILEKWNDASRLTAAS